MNTNIIVTVQGLTPFTAFQSTGYRYVTQGELNLIVQSGNKLPIHNSKGWFTSLDAYSSAPSAKSALQLPQPVETIVARIEFDLHSVQNNLRVAFDADDANKGLLEFTARAFPSNGTGGGTQLLIDGAEVPIVNSILISQ